MITVGSCFSGIGGIELGLEATGRFKTIWQIENDPYATAVLKKHWPGVERFGDIRTIPAERLTPVDLICGGYPCQPFSLAGKRKGADDARHLWPAMFRIICTVGPRYVLLENVPGHLSMGFGRVLGNLASVGYDAEWGVLSAAGVGAPHLRKRLFILAHTNNDGFSSNKNTAGIKPRKQSKQIREGTKQPKRSIGGKTWNSDVANTECGGRRESPRHFEKPQEPFCKTEREEGASFSGSGGSDVAHAKIGGWRQRDTNRQWSGAGAVTPEEWRRSSDSGWWIIEPNVGRMAARISNRVDRLKCLGNAVVPQVAEKIGRMILDAIDASRI